MVTREFSGVPLRGGFLVLGSCLLLPLAELTGVVVSCLDGSVLSSGERQFE